jgi:methionyl-tRNA synthetase
MSDRFISTAIPYVNASPHIGFVLELVIADVIARHARLSGDRVYFLSGTDDNSLKNALAAAHASMTTDAFVKQRCNEFAALKTTLEISYDDFLRTSGDPRHAPAVEKLWRACAANGDIYVDDYVGLYCVGCELFYAVDELTNGVCPEHGVRPERVSERNYFFRLSRYRDELIELLRSDAIAIRPVHRKNEILALLVAPLADLSISRSVERARGWGIAVPDDPSQIVYVWFDALANYISALGYSTDAASFGRYWTSADRISHVIGKGVSRFHAVYWPAILLSAGLRPPTEILVHGYITIEGQKISKSLGNTISPDDARRLFGLDALRYYLLRHVGSHHDGDFSWSRFREVYRHELADDLGNLLSRTTALGRRHGTPERIESQLASGLNDEVARHLEAFAVHRALESIWKVINAANAYVNQTAPWNLAKHGETNALHEVLGELYAALRAIGAALRPFMPDTADRIVAATASSAAVTLFPRGERT